MKIVLFAVICLHYNMQASSGTICYECVSSDAVDDFDATIDSQRLDPRCSDEFPDQSLLVQPCLACLTIEYNSGGPLAGERDRSCVTTELAQAFFTDEERQELEELPDDVAVCAPAGEEEDAASKYYCFCKQDGCLPHAVSSQADSLEQIITGINTGVTNGGQLGASNNGFGGFNNVPAGVPNNGQQGGFTNNNGQLGFSSNTGQVGFSTNTGQLGFNTNTGQLGFSTNTGQLGFSTNTGQLGFSTNTGQTGFSTNTGQLGGFGSNTGQLGGFSRNIGRFSSNTGGFSSNTGGFSSNTGQLGGFSSNSGGFGSNTGRFSSNSGGFTSNTGQLTGFGFGTNNGQLGTFSNGQPITSSFSSSEQGRSGSGFVNVGSGFNTGQPSGTGFVNGK